MMAVSMGPDGAWLVTESEEFYCKAPAVEKKSTVGAGDSMVAGMTYMLSTRQPLEEVIRFGVACGTAATMNAGTQLFKAEDVQQLYSLLKSA
jgi:6-phosphofructokinase 2